MNGNHSRRLRGWVEMVGVFLVSCSCCHSAAAAILGPYAADANTLHLYHYDAASGAIPDVGAGATLNLTDLTNPNPGNGAAAYTGFGKAYNLLTNGYHTTSATNGGRAATSAGPTQTQADFQSAAGAFTYEALIRLTVNDLTSTQVIMSRDGGTNRGWTFQISGGNLGLYDGIGTTYNSAIPTTGANAFAINQWFHVAISYNGLQNTANNLSFFWTLVDPSRTQANLLQQSMMTADVVSHNSNFFFTGSASRAPYRLELKGLIDEVRISNVARTANQFIFYQVPEPATWVLLLGGAAVLWGLRRRSARSGGDASVAEDEIPG